ncbi:MULTISPECIES: M24 family metallopeptidase [Actinomycetes]|uniref:Creatinase n=1 Tax=Williamsia marianensis TaxID=85044 RepID=A0A2G3PHF0_WILMA|nr:MULTISPECIES: M24 family metallopeptidase [Actinomycetes]PZU04136.1 MAG: creatinase [Gordonia sp. (in: high G+C Gram-positive bacteria)]MDV7132790.1 M24 family metallopeptidase [Williamsia muralis]PHV65163.1 creatinase [Williamsia marianensis]PVY29042.1 Xaa-Pro dipeptidase [Williamsia marianensis]RKR93942.1 Xaa-Pro dipeptidase [Williamsia muralis]
MYLGSQLFTDAEYEQRLAAVRKLMDRQGLSAIIVTDPANIFYLIGYNAWSFYTPQMLFVPMDGDMVFFARDMDARGAHRTTWLPDEQIVGYPESYIHRPHVHPFDWVAFALRQRHLIAPASRGGSVGLEMDSHFFSPKAYRALFNAIPEWKLVDCFELVNWVRSVKSDAEVQLMRQAGMVCSEAMRAAIDTIDIGVRQCDAAAAISQAQITGTDQFGGDYPAIVPMMPTGEAADTPHLTWHQGTFVGGEAVVVELTGAHNRYHCPLARTVSLGPVNKDVDYVAGATAEGLNNVLDAIAPGVPTRELASTWNWTLAKYGLEKPSRLGYSIGIGYPPDWGERTISIRTEDETILEENMTFHIVCGMWMDGYGFELSESVRVSATGVETFTSFPRDLIRK